MPLLTIDRNPSPAQLRWAGLLFGLFLAIVGLLVERMFASSTSAAVGSAAARAIWAIGAVATIVYYLAPGVRRPLYLGWLYAAYPIGWVVSHLMLAAIYFLVLTPIGLVLRATGRDPLERKFDRDADTYWAPCERASDPRRYFRQF